MLVIISTAAESTVTSVYTSVLKTNCSGLLEPSPASSMAAATTYSGVSFRELLWRELRLDPCQWEDRTGTQDGPSAGGTEDLGKHSGQCCEVDALVRYTLWCNAGFSGISPALVQLLEAVALALCCCS